MLHSTVIKPHCEGRLKETLSVVSDSVTTWTVAHQAPLSMEFPQARILE